MKRTRIFFIVTLLFICSAAGVLAQKAHKPVTLNGRLQDKGAYSKIYLDTVNGKNPWICATAPIADDGTFQLVASVPKTDVYRLRLDDKNYLMIILSPGEKISMKFPGPKLGTDAVVDGSENTELLLRTMSGLKAFDTRRDSLNNKYAQIQSAPDKEALSKQVIDSFRANDSLQKAYLFAQMNKNPSSLAWLFFEDKLDLSADFARVEKIESAMYKAYPENLFVQQFHQKVDLERRTAIGYPAPDIVLPDASGNLTKLSSLKGKVVLIDFWASWCGPCRRENPNVVRIYNTYHDKGFEVFSVSLDKDRDSWLKAIAKDNLVWSNHVSDLKYWNSEGAKTYGVSAIPYTVLIDRKGRIVAKKLRGDELEQKVAELLQ